MVTRLLRRVLPPVCGLALLAGLVAPVEPAAAGGSPPNDDLADAQVIAGASGTVNGSTVGAGYETGEPTAFRYRTIWYRWTAPATGHTRFALTTPGTEAILIDAFVGTALSDLELRDREGFETDGSVEVTIPTVAGTTYVIRAMSNEDDQIPVTLDWMASTPPNDDFADPTFVGNGAGVFHSANVSATEEAQEPDHAGVTTSTSVWFEMQTTRAGVLTLSTQGSSFDTVLAAYQGGGALGSLTEIASNDDAAGLGLQSQISFNVSVPQAVIIAVDGFNGATGAIELHWSFPPPANDDFASAQNLAGASGSGSGTTAGATAEADEPNHAGVSGLNGTFSSVWYTWTAPSPGRFTFRTKDPRQTDSTVAVYQGADVANLFELGSNDDTRDFQSGEDAEVTVLAASGETYKVAVADQADPAQFGGPGDVSFDWALTACPALPPDTPAWVQDAVNWVICLALMTGYPDGTFRPNEPITRAQVARVLYRIAGEPYTNELPEITQTDVPSWVLNPVRWLIGNGFATGYPDNTFRPNEPITRAQLARMVFRIAGSPSGAPAHPFTDVPAWVTDAVNWLTDPANSPPYVTGYPDNTFRPDISITRAQATRMVCRIDTPTGTC